MPLTTTAPSTEIKEQLADFESFISRMSRQQSRNHDEEFHRRLSDIDELSKAYPKEQLALMKCFFELCGAELDRSLLHERGRQKPLGYAGDYLMIDWIYTKKACPSGTGAFWDEFFHRQAAPTAVRNRKEYFINLFGQLCRQRGKGISVLNLASGSCRDVAEAIERTAPLSRGSLFHCVDVERKAVEYASMLLQPHLPAVALQWQIASVFKFRTNRQYDLVWSAGLFDYLNDDAAVMLLRKMWGCVNVGGTMVIGNFHPNNPNRNYLEWCGGWFLIHRTGHDLTSLFLRAGIPENCLYIEQEPLGICVFCVATKRG